MDLKPEDRKIFEIIKKGMFANGIHDFIEKMDRNNKSLEEIDNDLFFTGERIKVLLERAKFSKDRITTLVGFFEVEFYNELYKIEMLKNDNDSLLEYYFFKFSSNLLSALKSGKYECTDELKRDLLEITRKANYLDALSQLIDIIYGHSTMQQKMMYFYEGVYYDKSEAFDRFQSYQDSQIDPQSTPAQR